MPTRTKLMLTVATAAAVVAGAFVAVQMLDGDPESKDRVRAGPVLDFLPASTTNFTFVDRDAAAQRLGVADIEHGASQADVDRYLESLQDEAAVTPLATHLMNMENSVVNDLDVDWYVGGRDPDSSWDIYRIDDRVDFDALAKDLIAAGYTRTEVDGNGRYSADLSEVDDRYPGTFLDLAVIKEQRLVVTGSRPEDIIAVVEGKKDALSGNDSALDLFAQVHSPEYVAMNIGADSVCGSDASDEAAARQQADHSGTSTLGRPEVVGTFVVNDDTSTSAVAVLGFSSTAEAEKDASAREAWLRTGLDPVMNAPNADYIDLESVEVSDRLVTVRADYANGPQMAASMAAQRSGPTVCGL